MRIGFIGAGKVGFSLGRLFAQNGIPVTGYYSRRRESALEAAHFTGSDQFDDLKTLTEQCDALFLTVPDGQITQVYRDLQSYSLKNKFICHCSGALSTGEAFPDLNHTGAFGCSVHPLFPVSDKYHSYQELSGAFFCLEGDEAPVEIFGRLLSGMGCRVQSISPESKVRYHAACAAASNLMCALAAESIELLKSCGFSEELALAALSPLMRSNLERIMAVGPREALTGPVERNDLGTVKKHLNCFTTHSERQLYRLLSEKLVSLAKERHPRRDYDQLEQLLSDGKEPYIK